MEAEKKLYPFKLVPVADSPDETWHLADLGYPDSMVRNGWLATNTLSEIMEMYMDRVVGEGVFAAYGRQFPVLIKTLNGTRRTPLWVHPDDGIAAERYDFLGKAKLWYVVSARPGSVLYLGFRRDVSPEAFYQACKDGSAEGLLHRVEPKAGDHFFIAPGTVHAAGEGVVIAEVAESSPLDFRLFNWGLPEGEIDPFDVALTLEEAFDFIDFGKYHPTDPVPAVSGGIVRLTDTPEFVASEIRLTDPLHVFCEQFGSFVAYHCLSGAASVEILAENSAGEKKTDSYGIAAGDTLLVPAEIPDFYLVPRAEGTLLLEAVSERHEMPDDFAEAPDGEKLLN